VNAESGRAWNAVPPAYLEPERLVEGLTILSGPGGARWNAQIERTGGCRHPIRLRGRIRTLDTTSGGLTEVYATSSEPRGVALLACKTRRAALCPSCAALYRGDAYQLIAGGLRGEKTGRPALFVTLTAPSFGPVHAARSGQPCRPRSAIRLCRHGRPLGCRAVHRAEDPLVAAPLCPDCADPTGTVLFNSLAPTLWRRTTIAVRRALAAQAGIPRRRLAEHARLSFVKIAEFQRRGVVHFHLLVRLDPPDGAGQLAERFNLGLLTAAVVDGVHATRLPLPADLPSELATRPDGSRRSALAWGEQLHVRAINLAARTEEEEQPSVSGRPSRSGRRVCGYLSKYATKACEDLGLRANRAVDSDDVQPRPRAHVTVLVHAAQRLADVPSLTRAGRFAHQLGYAGHFLTKSRAYSTTFTALRERRRAYTAARHPDPQTLARAAGLTVLADWRYAGRGHTRPGDEWLAMLAADRAKANREAIRIARDVGDLPPRRAA
jgi:hypothetical protein